MDAALQRIDAAANRPRRRSDHRVAYVARTGDTQYVVVHAPGRALAASPVHAADVRDRRRRDGVAVGAATCVQVRLLVVIGQRDDGRGIQRARQPLGRDGGAVRAPRDDGRSRALASGGSDAHRRLRRTGARRCPVRARALALLLHTRGCASALAAGDVGHQGRRSHRPDEHVGARGRRHAGYGRRRDPPLGEAVRRLRHVPLHVARVGGPPSDVALVRAVRPLRDPRYKRVDGLAPGFT